MRAVVYSKEGCQACKATLRWLTAHDVDHEVKDAADYAGFLRALGHAAAPVITIHDQAGHCVDTWAGHRPDRLTQYFKNTPKEAA